MTETYEAHYKKLKIEPIEYIEENDLGFHEGHIVKYISRWRNKGGVEDLQKARYYIDRLIQQHGREGAA